MKKFEFENYLSNGYDDLKFIIQYSVQSKYVCIQFFLKLF
jgi:hypothetical protein